MDIHKDPADLEKHELSKYATTPLQLTREPGGTHSPQLPAPSPNYPVQTQIPPQALETPDKTPESDQQRRRPAAAAHVPNTDVPTHITHSLNSDNDTPLQSTSQTDVCMQTTGMGVGVGHADHSTAARANNNNHDYVNYNKFTASKSTHDDSDNSLKTRANLQEEPTLPPTRNPPIYNCSIDPNETQAVSPLTNGYVLIVPQFNLQSAVTTSENSTTNSRDLLTIRRSRSKLDLAAKRRRRRRELRTPKSKRSDVEVANREERKSRTTIEYGLKIHGYSSESNSSDEMSSEAESDRDLDLWIRSGPPSKLDVSKKKTGFLSIFGLTTHYQKSEMELKKIERRKWAPPLLQLADEVEESRTDRLELPVPFESPSLLNKSADFDRKAGFLHGVGLRIVSSTDRRELEKNWMKVVQQRIKRKALMPLNNFYQRFGEKIRATKEVEDVILLTIPSFRDNAMQTDFTNVTTNFRARLPLPHGLTDCANTNVTSVLRTIPHATLFPKQQQLYAEKNETTNVVVLKQPPYNEVHYSRTLMHGIVPPEINPEAPMASARHTFEQPEQSQLACSVQACITNMVKEMVSTTTGMTITNGGGEGKVKLQLPQEEYREDTLQTIIEDVVQEKRKRKIQAQRHRDWQNWPGIKEMMAVYNKFSKGRYFEIRALQRKCEQERLTVEQQQAEVKRYEARQTELRKISTTCNLKRHNMEKAIDRLTNIITEFKASDR